MSPFDALYQITASSFCSPLAGESNKENRKNLSRTSCLFISQRSRLVMESMKHQDWLKALSIGASWLSKISELKSEQSIYCARLVFGNSLAWSQEFLQTESWCLILGDLSFVLNCCFLFGLYVFRISNQCSLCLWGESVAPSSRPSSHYQANQTCNRFRCRAAGSTMSASWQRPQQATRGKPAVPAPAQYRQVTLIQDFSWV